MQLNSACSASVVSGFCASTAFLGLAALRECQMKQMPRRSSQLPPLENWRRPSGYPRTTCIKTIHQDLKSNNLSLNEATDVAQNRPLWRLMSAFGGWYTLLVVHARNERMNYLKVRMQIFSLSDQKLFCLNFRVSVL